MYATSPTPVPCGDARRASPQGTGLIKKYPATDMHLHSLYTFPSGIPGHRYKSRMFAYNLLRIGDYKPILSVISIVISFADYLVGYVGIRLTLSTNSS